MAIIRKLKQGETTIFPMTDASAVQYAGKTLSEMIQEGFYSAQPVRIGTWINGTPIWRVAIPIQQFSRSSACIHSESDNTVYVDIGLLLANHVKNTDDCTLINANNIIGYTEYSSYTLRTFPDKFTGRICFSYQTPSIYEDLITFENGFFGGWIEFVTPENNIVL